jgi:hypothetical protein
MMDGKSPRRREGKEKQASLADDPCYHQVLFVLGFACRPLSLRDLHTTSLDIDHY